MTTAFKAIREDHRRVRALLRDALDVERTFARARVRLEAETLVASTLHADLESLLQGLDDGSAEAITAALALIQTDRGRVDAALADLLQLNQALAVERVERLAQLREALDLQGEVQEAALYPALVELGLDEFDVAFASEQHHLIDALLLALARTDPLSVRFEARWALLARTVETHLREQERRLLAPALRQAAPEDLLAIDEALDAAQAACEANPTRLRVSFFRELGDAALRELR